MRILAHIDIANNYSTVNIMTDLGDVLESVLPHRVMYFQSNFFILHAFHIHPTSELVGKQALGLVSETLSISKKWDTTCLPVVAMPLSEAYLLLFL